MAEIDGRDAVEIICNTECVEKDDLLLSLCKAFLTQQLHNGDMYYIWYVRPLNKNITVTAFVYSVPVVNFFCLIKT